MVKSAGGGQGLVPGVEPEALVEGVPRLRAEVGELLGQAGCGAGQFGEDLLEFVGRELQVVAQDVGVPRRRGARLLPGRAALAFCWPLRMRKAVRARA